MSKPGDYDPWQEVVILWDHNSTTKTLVRRSEIAGYIASLPIERVVMFSFGKAPDPGTEKDAPPE